MTNNNTNTAPVTIEDEINDPQIQFLFFALCILLSISILSFSVKKCCFFRPQYEKYSLIFFCISISCLWYSSSMSIVIMNRMILGFMGKQFAYPVIITTAHMAIKSIISVLVVLTSSQYLTPVNRLLPWIPRTKARIERIIETQQLSYPVLLRYIIPLGVVTAIDVWMSNISLQYIDVSVYTTTKSTAIIFNLIFTMLLKLVKPNPKLIIAVLGIAIGVILTSIKEAGINIYGILAALLAAICSASRWVITESYLHREKMEENNILVLITLLGPVSVLSLLIPASFEAYSMYLNNPFHSSMDTGIFSSILVGGGIMAFILVYAELQLVAVTSALTLSVIGHAKDVVVVLLSLAVFHDNLSSLNSLGVTLTIVSTTAYSIIKVRLTDTQYTQLTGAEEEKQTTNSSSSSTSSNTRKSSHQRNKVGTNGSNISTTKPTVSIISHDGIDTTKLGNNPNNPFNTSTTSPKHKRSLSQNRPPPTVVQLDFDDSDLDTTDSDETFTKAKSISNGTTTNRSEQVSLIRPSSFSSSSATKYMDNKEIFDKDEL